jgi:hypothetical protein
MVREQPRRYGPFGALRVERVTKPDGRYVLYYSWPTDAEAADGRPAMGSAMPGTEGAATRGTGSPPIPPGARPEPGRARERDV